MHLQFTYLCIYDILDANYFVIYKFFSFTYPLTKFKFKNKLINFENIINSLTNSIFIKCSFDIFVISYLLTKLIKTYIF